MKWRNDGLHVLLRCELPDNPASYLLSPRRNWSNNATKWRKLGLFRVQYNVPKGNTKFHPVPVFTRVPAIGLEDEQSLRWNARLIMVYSNNLQLTKREDKQKDLLPGSFCKLCNCILLFLLNKFAASERQFVFYVCYWIRIHMFCHDSTLIYMDAAKILYVPICASTQYACGLGDMATCQNNRISECLLFLITNHSFMNKFIIALS